MTILKLFIFCAFFIVGQADAASLPVEHNLIASVQQVELSTHERVNAHRSSKGLPGLEFNEDIANIARKHSENMASGSVPFGHAGVTQRYDEMKVTMTIQKMAENVGYAWGYDVPDEIVVDLWVNSDGHRRNMEGDYNVTGIGVAIGPDGAYYFTQLFAKKVN